MYCTVCNKKRKKKKDTHTLFNDVKDLEVLWEFHKEWRKGASEGPGTRLVLQRWHSWC